MEKISHNPWLSTPYVDNFDLNEDLPLQNKDAVEFTAILDYEKQEVFLFARIENQKNYLVGTCPFLGLYTTQKKEKHRIVQLEQYEVKIAEKFFSEQKGIHLTTPFFHYLSDVDCLTQELMSQFKNHTLSLEKASKASYCEQRKSDLIKGLGKAIEKGQEECVDRAMKVGTLVNETYFVCSEGFVFKNKRDIAGHVCDITYSSYNSGSFEHNTKYSRTYSTEYTPLSHARAKKHSKIEFLLKQNDAEKLCSETYNFSSSYEWTSSRDTGTPSHNTDGGGGF